MKQTKKKTVKSIKIKYKLDDKAICVLVSARADIKNDKVQSTAKKQAAPKYLPVVFSFLNDITPSKIPTNDNIVANTK